MELGNIKVNLIADLGQSIRNLDNLESRLNNLDNRSISFNFDNRSLVNGLQTLRDLETSYNRLSRQLSQNPLNINVNVEGEEKLDRLKNKIDELNRNSSLNLTVNQAPIDRLNSSLEEVENTYDRLKSKFNNPLTLRILEERVTNVIARRSGSNSINTTSASGSLVAANSQVQGAGSGGATNSGSGLGNSVAAGATAGMIASLTNPLKNISKSFDKLSKDIIASINNLSKKLKNDNATLKKIINKGQTKKDYEKVGNALFTTQSSNNPFEDYKRGSKAPTPSSSTSGFSADLVSGLGNSNVDYEELGRMAAALYEKGFKDRAEIKSPSRVFIRIGKNIVKGFELGTAGFDGIITNITGSLGKKINDSKKSVESSGKKIGFDLLRGTKKALEIKSPSQEYEDIGEDVSSGLFEGLKDAEKPLEEFNRRVRERANDIKDFTGRAFNEIAGDIQGADSNGRYSGTSLLRRDRRRGEPVSTEASNAVLNDIGNNISNAINRNLGISRNRSNVTGSFNTANPAPFLASLGTMASPTGALLASVSPIAVALLPTLVTALLSGGLFANILDKVSNAIQRIEPIRRKFETLTGSPESAKTELDRTSNIASELGIPVEAAVSNFAGLSIASQGTALEGEGVENIFTGFSSAIKDLGLNSEEAEQVFGAITQMISGGVLSLEELRGQLSEALPIAMDVFARALGIPSSELAELVSTGSVLSSEVLPKVADILNNEFGNIGSEGVKTFTGALTRLENAGFEVAVSLTDTFGETFGFIANKAADLTEFIANQFEIIAKTAAALLVGITAQVAVGLQTILAAPAIKKVATNISTLVFSSFVKSFKLLTPFFIGSLSLIASEYLGAELSVFENIIQASKNAYISFIDFINSVSRGQNGEPLINLEVGVLKSSINLVKDLLSPIKKLFEVIPSGVIEFTALVLVLDQLMVVGTAYLLPMIKSLIVSAQTMFLTFRAGIGTTISLRAGLMGVAKGAVAAVTSVKALMLAAQAAFAVIILALANSDFSKPITDEFREARFETNQTFELMKEDIKKFGKDAGELGKEVGENIGDGIKSGLDPQGFELSLGKILGISEESNKSDSLIEDIQNGEGALSRLLEANNIFNGKASGFGYLAYFRARSEASEIAEPANELLSKYGIGDLIPADSNLVTTAQSNLFSDVSTLHNYAKDVKRQLEELGFAGSDISGFLLDIEKPLEELKEKESEIQELRSKRSELASKGTTAAKEEISSIDERIVALEKQANNIISDINSPIEQIFNIEEQLEEQIKFIEENVENPRVRRALLSILRPTLESINETTEALEAQNAPLDKVQSRWQAINEALNDARERFKEVNREAEVASSRKTIELYNRAIEGDLSEAGLRQELSIKEYKELADEISRINKELSIEKGALQGLRESSNPTKEQQNIIDDTEEKINNLEKQRRNKNEELARSRLQLIRSQETLTEEISNLTLNLKDLIQGIVDKIINIQREIANTLREINVLDFNNSLREALVKGKDTIVDGYVNLVTDLIRQFNTQFSNLDSVRITDQDTQRTVRDANEEQERINEERKEKREQQERLRREQESLNKPVTPTTTVEPDSSIAQTQLERPQVPEPPEAPSQQTNQTNNAPTPTYPYTIGDISNVKEDQLKAFIFEYLDSQGIQTDEDDDFKPTIDSLSSFLDDRQQRISNLRTQNNRLKIKLDNLDPNDSLFDKKSRLIEIEIENNEKIIKSIKENLEADVIESINSSLTLSGVNNPLSKEERNRLLRLGGGPENYLDKTGFGTIFGEVPLVGGMFRGAGNAIDRRSLNPKIDEIKDEMSVIESNYPTTFSNRDDYQELLEKYNIYNFLRENFGQVEIPDQSKLNNGVLVASAGGYLPSFNNSELERQSIAQLPSLPEETEETEKQSSPIRATHPLENSNATITSGFGPRNISTPNASKNHKGVDFATSQGAPIRSVLPGTVENVAFDEGGFGNFIDIRHDDDLLTRYAHLFEKSKLSVGDKVDGGQIIGGVGSTGTSSGPHLHFEVIINGQQTDPIPWLEQAIVQGVNNKASFENIDFAALENSISKIEGSPDSIGSFTQGGRGLGKFQFMSYRDDVRAIIESKEGGAEFLSKLDNSKGASDAEKQELKNELLNFFTPRDQEELFRKTIKDLYNAASSEIDPKTGKRFDEGNQLRMIERISQMHFGGVNSTIDGSSSDVNGRLTLETYGQEVANNYLKNANFDGEFKPTEPTEYDASRDNEVLEENLDILNKESDRLLSSKGQLVVQELRSITLDILDQFIVFKDKMEQTIETMDSNAKQLQEDLDRLREQYLPKKPLEERILDEQRKINERTDSIISKAEEGVEKSRNEIKDIESLLETNETGTPAFRQELNTLKKRNEVELDNVLNNEAFTQDQQTIIRNAYNEAWRALEEATTLEDFKTAKADLSEIENTYLEIAASAESTRDSMLEAARASMEFEQFSANMETFVDVLPSGDVFDRSRRDRLSRDFETEKINRGLETGELTEFQADIQLRKLKEDTNTLKNELEPLKSSFADFFDSISDRSTTAMQAFTGFLSSVLDSLKKLAVELAANKLFELLFGNLLSGLTGPSGAAASSAGNAFTGASNFSFSSGNTLFPTAYADGGIVNKPTLGLIGEAGLNEAVVPLPNGKSIPVEMNQHSGGDNINVNINVDKPTVRDDSDLESIANLVDTKIRKTLIDQSRPGGLLRRK